jgi:hypothetical protein
MEGIVVPLKKLLDMVKRPNSGDDLILAPGAVALIALPILVIFVGDYFYGSFNWTAIAADASTISPGEEVVGRIRVVAAFLPFMLVALLIVLDFLRELLFLMGKETRRRICVGALLLTAAMGADLFWKTGMGDGKVFQKALAGPHVVAVRETLSGAFSVILIAAAVSLIMGTISCISRPADTVDAATSARLAEMQRSRLDGYLYASAMLLVTGMFFIAAGLRWSVSARSPQFLGHVNLLIVYYGIFFSTLLASYYVPAASWLRRSLETVPQAPGQDSDGAKAEDASFVDMLSPSRLLKAIVAILAPLIVSLVPHLLKL